MEKKSSRIVILLSIHLMFLSVVSGGVTLPAIISDNMVLQQKSEAPLWGWARPGEQVKIRAQWQDKEYLITTASDGSWQIKLKTPEAGGPYRIVIEGQDKIILQNVMIGEVWLCSGQSNMSFPLLESLGGKDAVAEANCPSMRVFVVQQALSDMPNKNCQGRWQICSPESAGSFSAVAYYFGRELQNKLKVPVGLMVAAWGGTPADCWMSRSALESDSDFVPVLRRYDEILKDYPREKKIYDEQLALWKAQDANANSDKSKLSAEPRLPIGPEHWQRPYGTYNGMITPLIPYRLAGVIWYQGEGNSWRAHQYEKMFPALIRSWRNSWGQGNFPFYYVQIAPYKYEPPLVAAELRHAQLMTLSESNTGMIVTMDIGDANNIHPLNKKDVGKRLALWALAKNYGNDKIVYSGPIYKGINVESSKIRVFFSHVGSGLIFKNDASYEFEIAGDDGKYVVAKAEIDGDTVLVYSPQIKKPVAVRYCWSNFAQASFFNKDGLPASPFKTDSWPGVTDDQKTYF